MRYQLLQKKGVSLFWYYLERLKLVTIRLKDDLYNTLLYFPMVWKYAA
jgi:hypothetical protein